MHGSSSLWLNKVGHGHQQTISFNITSNTTEDKLHNGIAQNSLQSECLCYSSPSLVQSSAFFLQPVAVLSSKEFIHWWSFSYLSQIRCSGWETLLYLPFV